MWLYFISVSPSTPSGLVMPSSVEYATALAVVVEPTHFTPLACKCFTASSSSASITSGVGVSGSSFSTSIIERLSK